MSEKADTPYDYKTPEYKTYVEAHIAWVNGNLDDETHDAAFAAAQAAAGKYQSLL